MQLGEGIDVDNLSDQLAICDPLPTEEAGVPLDALSAEDPMLKVNRGKRKYDRVRALETRRRNRELKRLGLPVPPAYRPRKGYGLKRQYVASGRYV